jgi:hypothetical protein
MVIEQNILCLSVYKGKWGLGRGLAYKVKRRLKQFARMDKKTANIKVP